MVGLALLGAAAGPHEGVLERGAAERVADVEEVGEREDKREHDVGLRHAFGGVVRERVRDFVGEDGREPGFAGAEGEDAWAGWGLMDAAREPRLGGELDEGEMRTYR